MFIYEFMAKIADTITTMTTLEEQEFDPHKHRDVPHPITTGETMTHLLKCSIGAGLLAMPSAVSRVGLIVAPFAITLTMIFACYCLQMLIKAQYELCRRNRRGYISYAKSLRIALGTGPPVLRPFGKCLDIFINAVLLIWQIGICAVYVVFTSENIKQVFDFYDLVISLRYHIICLLPALFITNMSKSLKVLTPFSFVSNIIILAGTALVSFYLIEDDIVLDNELLMIKTLVDIPSFIGITLFALEAVGVILALEYTMAEPKKFIGICGLFNRGIMIVGTIYIILGILGFIKYGNEIKASITLNLPQSEKKAQASKLLMAVAIFLSFPLQNFVGHSLAVNKLRKCVKPKRLRCLDYVLRIVLVIIPWAMALAFPHLGPFIELFGALCLSLLAVVFPAILDLCIWYPDKYGVLRWRLLKDLMIIAIGLIILVSGVYTSIAHML